MADKLLPCPFCGGEAGITQDFVHGWKVMCVDWMNCIAHPLVQIYGEGSRKKAIEAWNNRPGNWHTGTPTEEGWYLVTSGGNNSASYDIGRWDGESFCFMEYLDSADVLAWQKITPYEGEKE